MKKLLLSLFLLSFSILSSAQEDTPASEICGSARIHNQLMLTDPAYAAKVLEFDSHDTSTARDINTAATHIIPVVVHVMHKGEAIGTGTNVSDDAIREKIKSINQQFRKTSGTMWDGVGVDTGIEFALAVRDPANNCTNGINRIDMSGNSQYMQYGVRSYGPLGLADTTLKAMSVWNQTQYYNIWIVWTIDNQSSTLGYATMALSHGSPDDGAVILSSSVTNLLSAVEVHELGHALNLHHTFEGDNNGTSCPASATGCGTNLGDCCTDTPPHIRSNNCNAATNTCDGNSNAIIKTNYMNYTPDTCKSMFTANQASRMNSALVEIRASFLPPANNKLVPPVNTFTADFIQSASTGCVGATINFKDITPCVPNTYLNDDAWSGISFSWTVTNGTVTLTSNQQNPAFTMTSPGFYNVSFTVTGAGGSNTKTVTNAIHVYGASANACTPTTSNPNTNSGFTINNVSFGSIQNTTSSIYNSGYTNYICDKIAIVAPGQVYPMAVSLHGGNGTSTLVMETYIDYNNNGTFETTEKVLFGSTGAGTTNNVTGNITIPLTAVQDTLLRMRVIGETGTISSAEKLCNLPYFMSDIEDYGVYIQNPLSTGQFSADSMTYYPNPVSNTLNIKAVAPISNVIVYTVLGQVVWSTIYASDEVEVDLSKLSAGIYMVKAMSGERSTTFRIIKK